MTSRRFQRGNQFIFIWLMHHGTRRGVSQEPEVRLHMFVGQTNLRDNVFALVESHDTISFWVIPQYHCNPSDRRQIRGSTVDRWIVGLRDEDTGALPTQIQRQRNDFIKRTIRHEDHAQRHPR